MNGVPCFYVNSGAAQGSELLKEPSSKALMKNYFMNPGCAVQVKVFSCCHCDRETPTRCPCRPLFPTPTSHPHLVSCPMGHSPLPAFLPQHSTPCLYCTPPPPCPVSRAMEMVQASMCQAGHSNNDGRLTVTPRRPRCIRRSWFPITLRPAFPSVPRSLHSLGTLAKAAPASSHGPGSISRASSYED